ncbi:DMT family transporter [Kiloniella sp. b19]|uniref:DMT family transporter n=1 Tax=Kiloniella sp. GXU_MW_B19 TaxID=3141326 RepID=UPI0031D852F4
MIRAGNQVRSDYRLGLLFITLSTLAWSTAGLFTRFIELDTATMLVWRGLFGGVGILAVAFFLQGRKLFRDLLHLGWAGWGFALISAGGMLCYINALRITTVAHVAIIYATAPFVAAALAWLVLKERPASSALKASLVSLAGIGIMVGLGVEGDLFGDLLAFGMTLSLAFMMVISRRFRSLPVVAASGLSSLISGLVAVPFAESLAVSSFELGQLALFGLVNSAVGLLFFTLGAKLLPAIETALIGALDAPLAPIWVWLVFAETLGQATLYGGAIVLVAVFAHLVVQNRKPGRRGETGAC